MSRGFIAYLIAVFVFTAGVKAQLSAEKTHFKPDDFMEKNLALLSNQATKVKPTQPNKIKLSY